MQVFEVFGVAPDNVGMPLSETPSPGATHIGVLHWRTEEVADDSAWPASEVHDTVGQIEVRASGDDTGSVFLRVAGFDRSKAEATWRRVAESIPLDNWWGTPLRDSSGIDPTPDKRHSNLRYQVMVCTRCQLMPDEVKPDVPTKTTSNWEDGIFYITPHADTCIRVGGSR